MEDLYGTTCPHCGSENFDIYTFKGLSEYDFSNDDAYAIYLHKCSNIECEKEYGHKRDFVFEKCKEIIIEEVSTWI